MSFDIENLKELVKSMEENGISEFSFEDTEMKLKLKRGQEPAPQGQVYQQVPVVEEYIETTVDTKTPEVESIDNSHSVNSPMVGTFYTKPSPDAPAFVKVGDRIELGQVLCIVEAMKMMNEIKSDKAGIISKILLEDGSPVKKGDKLFLID